MPTKSTSGALLAVLVVVAATVGVVGVASAAPAAATAQDECTFPFEGEDATGTTVTIGEKPERIVSAAPSVAQTLYEIGAWENVVGVSAHANFLDGFEEREVVSTEGEPGLDVETIVDLEPDLVVVPQGFLVEDAEQLRDAGVTVYVFDEAASVDGVTDQVRLMGELTGECEGAEETVEWMNDELATVEAAVEGEEPVEALYVYSPEFGPYTSGEGTFIGDAVETAGAVNVAAEAGVEGHQTISDEVVAAEDPEWLVVNDNDGEPPGNDVYDGTTAVQEDNVVVVDANHLNQPGPRIVHAIAAMAEAFHPEAYEQAQATPTETATETPTPEEPMTETATADDAATATSEDEGTPGFGAVVALVAVLAAALLAIRRE